MIGYLMLNPNVTPESLNAILEARNEALKRVLDASVEHIAALPLEQRANAVAKVLGNCAQFGLIGF